MSRTISISGVPKRLFQYLVAGFTVFLGLLFGGYAVQAVLEAAGVAVAFPEGPISLVLFAILWVGLTVLWVRSACQWEGSGSMWGPIPEEQYTGRFADAGGIARHNWEKAIRQLPDRDEE